MRAAGRCQDRASPEAQAALALAKRVLLARAGEVPTCVALQREGFFTEQLPPGALQMNADRLRLPPPSARAAGCAALLSQLLSLVDALPGDMHASLAC